MNASGEQRKKLNHQVLYLSTQTQELSQGLLQSKLKIGELEAENKELRLRLHGSLNSNEIQLLQEKVWHNNFKSLFE